MRIYLNRLLYYLFRDINTKLDLILKNQEKIMAVNSEVLAYAQRIDAATSKLADDIRKILSNQTTVLSPEDRATLETSVGSLETLGTSSDPDLPKT